MYIYIYIYIYFFFIYIYVYLYISVYYLVFMVNLQNLIVTFAAILSLSPV